MGGAAEALRPTTPATATGPGVQRRSRLDCKALGVCHLNILGQAWMHDRRFKKHLELVVQAHTPSVEGILNRVNL